MRPFHRTAAWALVIALALGAIAPAAAGSRYVTRKQLRKVRTALAAKLADRYTKAESDARYAHAGDVLWAVVDDIGVIVQGRGFISSSHPATGQYLVTAARDVSVCSAVASLGGYPVPPAGNSGYPVGQIATLVSAGPTAATVRVFTMNSDGAPANQPFHLQVVC